MINVGCVFCWNVADHPFYICFMTCVCVRELRRTALQVRFSDLENELVNISVQTFQKFTTDFFEVSVKTRNNLPQLHFKPRILVSKYEGKLHSQTCFPTTMCGMFKKTILTTGAKINAVKVMRPEIIDIGYSVLCIYGTAGARGALEHQNKLLGTLIHHDISAPDVRYSYTDTAAENSVIYTFPFTDHQHWQYNEHRLHLALENRF